MGILSWFARTRNPEEPSWMRRWVILGRGPDDPKLAAIKRAAAEDVAEMEAEDHEHFRPHAPGHIEDDL